MLRMIRYGLIFAAILTTASQARAQYGYGYYGGYGGYGWGSTPASLHSRTLPPRRVAGLYGV
jgi:hypothetical protein